MQETLKTADYDQACTYIQKYLQFDLKSLASVFPDDPDEPSPLKILETSRLTLAKAVTREFDIACQKENNEVGIMKFVKFFPMIGESDVGLDKFGGFLCSLISKSCQEGMRNVNENGKFSGRFNLYFLIATSKDPVYANLLTNIFESVANIIDRQYNQIESIYGTNKMLVIISKLQSQAESQSSIILDSFVEKKQVSRKVIASPLIFYTFSLDT